MPEAGPNAQLRAMLHGVNGVIDEAGVLAFLHGLDQTQLRSALDDPALVDRLVASIDDHWFGQSHREELVKLLLGSRAQELPIETLAAVVHGLQRHGLSPHSAHSIRDLFAKTEGFQLTLLKNAIDAFPDDRDLESLVFSQFIDPLVREQTLDHIRVQAEKVHTDEAKVLSDIDDTAICRLLDRRFPKGILYPGATAFWEGLDKGPFDQPLTMGDLAFITGRPSDMFGLIENWTKDSLRRAGVAGGAVLTGSFRYIFDHAGMARKKIENIGHLRLLYPEYQLVFIGDSGQSDVAVGEALFSDFEGVVRAVFIHDVVPTDPAIRAERATRGIHYFDTYVGAATMAVRLGLMSWASAAQVRAETMAGFDEVPWDDDAQEGAMRALLTRDLAEQP